MRAANPFTPTFGVDPPLLLGRDEVLEAFADAVGSPPGSPGQVTLYSGPRGIGKTVMLNAVERIARDHGWEVISETSTTGLVTRLVAEKLPGLLADDRRGRNVRRRASGLTLPVIGGGVAWETTELHKAAAGLRNQLEQLLDPLAKEGVGLLLTVDELHPRRLDDLQQLFAVVQHARREGRPLAVAAAGLPSTVAALLDLPGSTFLQRADRHDLGAVDPVEVAAGIRTAVDAAGRSIGPAALELAAEATDGYPFMIQLVGYHVWRQSPDRPTITTEDVEAGVAAATRRIGQLVHQPSLRDTSAVDRTFLVAMAEDDGPSRVGDITSRMNVSRSYASQYRLRLLRAELIREVGYGQVDFAVPYLREYLREHAAALVGKR